MSKTCLRTLLFISFCATQAGACVVGLLGKAAVLSCFYKKPENLASMNFSFAWRRGDQIVYTESWKEGHEDRNTTDSRISASSRTQTEKFTMELSNISLSDANNYSLHLSLAQGPSVLICTVCLKVAANFTPPTLLRESRMEGKTTQLFCQSEGGFPKPVVHWYINHSQRPPVEMVSTHMNPAPQSQLYNISSILSGNISPETTVSCTIENPLLNETLTVISHGVSQSSKFLWTLSAALCVLVTVLVTVALCYQRKLDREIRRECGEDSGSEDTEMIPMDTEL